MNVELPESVANCQNLDGDMASIAAWASVFSSPATLFKTASKNYLLHRKVIK